MRKNEKEIDAKKLESLAEFHSIANTLFFKASLHDSMKQTGSDGFVPILTIESSIVQEMFMQIEKTNQVLSRLMKRPTDFWLTHEETLKFFGVGQTTLRNWRNRGLIAYTQYERKIMFHWDDISEFLKSNRYDAFQRH